MALTTKDKNFLIKSMKQSKRLLKLFGKGIPKSEIDFMNSIEPAITNNNLNEEQITFLIKNMESVYQTTRIKYIKKELIVNLKSLLEIEEKTDAK